MGSAQGQRDGCSLGEVLQADADGDRDRSHEGFGRGEAVFQRAERNADGEPFGDIVQRD